MSKFLSVIVPAYNEGETIGVILTKLQEVKSAYPVQYEIIVVNDCSTDHTVSAVQDFINNTSANIRLISHTTNLGKGAALRTGIQHATGDYVIIQDADLEYDPEEF